MSNQTQSAKSAVSAISRTGIYGTQSTTNPPLTKLREYVHVGGRLLSTEEKSCVPSLSPASASFPQGEGAGSITVSTSSGCNWVATSNASWITITGSSTGIGSSTISYTVTANSGAQRSSTIAINGQAFMITQAPSPGSCAYSMNKTGESISEQGGNGALTLTTGAGCPWKQAAALVGSALPLQPAVMVQLLSIIQLQ